MHWHRDVRGCCILYNEEEEHFEVLLVGVWGFAVGHWVASAFYGGGLHVRTLKNGNHWDSPILQDGTRESGATNRKVPLICFVVCTSVWRGIKWPIGQEHVHRHLPVSHLNHRHQRNHYRRSVSQHPRDDYERSWSYKVSGSQRGLKAAATPLWKQQELSKFWKFWAML